MKMLCGKSHFLPTFILIIFPFVSPCLNYITSYTAVYSFCSSSRLAFRFAIILQLCKLQPYCNFRLNMRSFRVGENFSCVGYSVSWQNSIKV
uniref:Cadherin domain-containing protein n=1 Tax=Parascaris univalens TaxID=6257 RepID=A0A915B1G3_PARUN